VVLDDDDRLAGVDEPVEQPLSDVWGYDYDPGSNVGDVYAGYLRRKLGQDSIETVRGMGYRLTI
jgi:DNA-binding response OmpR family regulator